MFLKTGEVSNKLARLNICVSTRISRFKILYLVNHHYKSAL